MQSEIDSKSFLLVVHIPSPLDRVSEEDISAYVRTIIGDTSYTIIKIPDKEKQLALVECPTEISIIPREFFIKAIVLSALRFQRAQSFAKIEK